MELYIVRHAQSKRNAGHHTEEDAELSEIGEEQARRLGKFFHEAKLDKIYCSTLKRARSTLKEIKPYLEGVPITFTPKIVEHKMGIYSRNGKDDWSSYFKKAIISEKGIHLFRPKEGDSLQDTYDRAGKFYRGLLKKHTGKNILLVGHGFFNTYLILNALNLKVNEGKYFKLSNASVSTLKIDKKGKVKHYHINDYNHLIAEAVKKLDS